MQSTKRYESFGVNVKRRAFSVTSVWSQFYNIKFIPTLGHSNPKVLLKMVTSGPFESQNGLVEEIDHEKGKIQVSVDIFGRKTLVELENWQVERA